MSNVTFLKKYVLPSTDESIRQEYEGFKHMLFSSSEEIIEKCDLELTIPLELKQFYLEIGYGFFYHKNDYSNDTLLNPNSFKIINNREEYYKEDPELELYEETEYQDKLIFFEVNEGIYLLITKEAINGKNAIYFFDKKIANSLEEFLIRFDEEGHYFEEDELS